LNLRNFSKFKLELKTRLDKFHIITGYSVNKDDFYDSNLDQEKETKVASINKFQWSLDFWLVNIEKSKNTTKIENLTPLIENEF